LENIMAIHSSQSISAATNLRYSAFLGMLYVSTPETEAAIKEAKALVGEAAVKKGYHGYKGDTPSAMAIAFLREKGISSVKVSGKLISARVIERDVDGRKTPYLNVGLKDDDGRYYLSVDLGQSAAQMLARKLVYAAIGVTTEISLFATYAQREGATRPYAEHVASLKQNGAEVTGINPKESLVPQIDAALLAMENAGVSRNDKETYAKRRATVELEYHAGLMKSVNDRFTAFYAAAEQQHKAEQTTAETAAAPEQGTTGEQSSSPKTDQTAPQAA
jgi:hypothetical protein